MSSAAAVVAVAAVGSGICSMQCDDGWLDSESGVRLEISSCAGKMVNGDPQHPLHESGKIFLFGTVHWQACLTPLAQAGAVENRE